MSMKMTKISTMVRPAEDTPKHNLWLSRLDMLPAQPLHLAAIILVFYPTHEEKTRDNNNNNNFFDPNIMKKALSKVLVPFYPMAGRLREDSKGRIEIECNGEGALFIEAETDHSLADFGDYKPTMELRKFAIPSCDFSKGIGSFPLVSVQMTRFRCGGVILGFAQHHHMADGLSQLYFIKSWGRLAMGLDLEFMPYHERVPHLSPRNPPQVKFQHVEFDCRPKGLLGNPQVSLTTRASVFKFTKEQINGLKEKATSSEEVNHKLTTYQMLAGHIWRTACKARGLAEEQEVRLYIPTDGRYRLKNPALPKGYSGNVVFYPACIAKAGDLVRNSVLYAANKIHETMKKMTNEEYLRSAIDYMETHPNFEDLIRGPHTVRCPNLSINSWASLSLYEVDFGWGTPSYAGHGGISSDGQSFIVPNSEGDGGFTLSINLISSHMTLFEKYLYDFS